MAHAIGSGHQPATAVAANQRALLMKHLFDSLSDPHDVKSKAH
jgi:hypothetical protein